MELIRKNDPRQTGRITLGEDDYTDRLYGCFRFDNPRGGHTFTPELETEIIFRSGKKHKVTVPERMKIQLPDKKAVNNEEFRLDPIGDNLDTMMLLTMRAGWNQVEQDLRRIVELDPEGNFVARFESADYDIPVATASVAPLGERHTWIGMILVHPELRRQGIANAMMQHCVRYAIGRGKIINGLDATPMGNTVYGAVGYVDSYRIWRSVFKPAEFRESPLDSSGIARIEDRDLDELVRYDAARYLERGNVIRALYEDSRDEAYLWRDSNGDIGGYVLARPGRLRYFVGPFLADSEDVARNLLTHVCRSLDRRGVEEAFIDTPEKRFAEVPPYDKTKFDQPVKPSGHALIQDIAPVREFTRMYQVVDERKAEELVKVFMQREKLEPGSPRVEQFRETMEASVANATENMSFLDYEARRLQDYYWGITGPEKG